MSAYADFPTSDRCLVLGAGGFIGTNLCLALRARGVPVTGFGRSARPAVLDDIDWVRGSLDATPWDRRLERLVGGHAHVFDLIGAGLPNSSNDNPAQIVADAVPAKVRLLEACRVAGVRRYLFASSGGTVYGVTGTQPVAEDTPTEPISAYGIGKLVVEKYLSLYRHLYGLESRTLRIANAYGPFQESRNGQGLVAALLRRLLADQPVEIWGDGRIVRDYIHIDDVVDAMLACLVHEGPGRVFNVGSGTGRSVAEVIADAARVTGRSPRLIRREPRGADVPVNILDSSRLMREAQWAPRTSWEAGLASTAEWIARSG
ncbi:NAD-dependent epimerase/dehydratase family protein [Lichenicoccus roseus]|uniref:NAD-dependent epimerase/dehydratase family protein n=1 Tax=Lichenicoccus roseus TaxID=2683649 RepID=UPI0014861D83|nr:NAD-dependent epimerase/dehydratase family protein [Lichenicoccus roseus]